MHIWTSELVIVAIAAFILIFLIAYFYVTHSTPMDLMDWIAQIINGSRVPI